MSVKPRAFQGQYPPRWHSIINSPVGRLYVAASDNALTGIWYEEQAHFPLPHELGERITDPAGLVAEADEVAQAIGRCRTPWRTHLCGPSAYPRSNGAGT